VTPRDWGIAFMIAGVIGAVATILLQSQTLPQLGLIENIRRGAIVLIGEHRCTDAAKCTAVLYVETKWTMLASLSAVGVGAFLTFFKARAK